MQEMQLAKILYEAGNTHIDWICGENFTLCLGFHSAKWGYTKIQHYEIRDTFTKIVLDVCYDVEVESSLQFLDGEILWNKSTITADNARLDIKTNGLWGV